MSDTTNEETTTTEDVRPSDEATAQEVSTASIDAARLEQAEREARANLEGWQRERADFQNYKRRMEQQLREAKELGAHDAIRRMLPIIDDFSRAVDNIPTDLVGNPWVNGTAMILKKFDKLLEELSVQIVDPIGQPFDPRLHEAVGMDEASEAYPSGTVTATLQRGYVSGERVLRQALVRVAS
ncbi:MAG: nucleotide exchange factor GrpE [Anaerolineae bacterium]|nr:nucleotide exchange factor GrpE [Anaerolineae bacterium]MDW8172364.1 nucleotide exchange factor GrpE [Anaerolineae bacterium]